MPHMDVTGPQGQGAQGGRRRGRCEGTTLLNNGDSNCGLRLRHRRRGRGNGQCAAFRLVGAEHDSGFVQSCIEHLQSKIRSLQNRLDRLKSGFGM